MENKIAHKGYLENCFVVRRGDSSDSPSYKVIKYPLNSSDVDRFFSNFEIDSKSFSTFLCEIRSQIIANIFSFGYDKGTVKEEGY